MKKLTIIMTVGILALTGASYAQTGMQAGFMVGSSIPMSGDVIYTIAAEPPAIHILEGEFTNYHKAGWTFGGYVAGPISGLFGWRAEMGYDRMPLKKKSREVSDEFESFDGNYKVLRLQGGIEIAPWGQKSMPYGFFTMGLARQDANFNGQTFSGVDFQYDLGSSSKFGMSFGGGYNYAIGPNWGFGGDIHINYGNFEDSSRWWWNPTVQVFANF